MPDYKRLCRFAKVAQLDIGSFTFPGVWLLSSRDGHGCAGLVINSVANFLLIMMLTADWDMLISAHGSDDGSLQSTPCKVRRRSHENRDANGQVGP